MKRAIALGFLALLACEHRNDEGFLLASAAGRTVAVVPEDFKVVTSTVGVSLDGSASNDPAGGYMTYIWEQTAGAPVTMWNEGSNIASFNAPASADDLKFRLTVIGTSGVDTAEVNVAVRTLVLDAPDQWFVGYGAGGDVSPSFEPEAGVPGMVFEWTGMPLWLPATVDSGSGVLTYGPTPDVTDFQNFNDYADVAVLKRESQGRAQLKLTVRDGAGNVLDEDLVNFSVGPFANSVMGENVALGQPVFLNGGRITAGGATITSGAWSGTKPDGEAISFFKPDKTGLRGATDQRYVYFVPDQIGVYSVVVVQNGGAGVEGFTIACGTYVGNGDWDAQVPDPLTGLCGGCHSGAFEWIEDTHAGWSQSRHASALSRLLNPSNPLYAASQAKGDWRDAFDFGSEFSIDQRTVGWSASSAEKGCSVLSITPAIDGSGDVYVGGTFTSYNGTDKNRILRLNSNGTIDAGFDVGSGANGAVYSIVPDSDIGEVYLGGAFTNYKGEEAKRIVVNYYSGDPEWFFYGAWDWQYWDNFNNDVYAIEPVLDGWSGDVYVGGKFTNFAGTETANRIARLDYWSGDLSWVFNGGTGFDNDVFSLAYDYSTTNLYVGGSFTNYNGTPAGRIIQLYSDGSVETDFSTNSGTGFDGKVKALKIDSSGRVVAGGAFAGYNGGAAGRIIRLNPDGTADGFFVTGTGFNGVVQTIAIDSSSGSIYVGGSFSSYNGAAVGRIVRLNSDGSRDAAFNVGTGFNGAVQTIAVTTDGVYVGGAFTSYKGTPVGRIVRLSATDGSIDTSFDIGTGFTADAGGGSSGTNSGWSQIASADRYSFRGSTWEDVRRKFPRTRDRSNVQCESCHGPGSEHKGDTSRVRVSYDSALCGRCHDEKFDMWSFSSHGRSPDADISGRAECNGCHTGQGYIADMRARRGLAATPVLNSGADAGRPVIPMKDRRGTGCQACHDSHTATQLRAYGGVQFRNGAVVDAGRAAVCYTCHQSGVDGRSGSDDLNARRAPHESTSAEMLEGAGGQQFADWTNGYAGSPHASATGDRKCLRCHMDGGPAAGASGYKAMGGHGFAMRQGSGAVVAIGSGDGATIEGTKTVRVGSGAFLGQVFPGDAIDIGGSTYTIVSVDTARQVTVSRAGPFGGGGFSLDWSVTSVAKINLEACLQCHDAAEFSGSFDVAARGDYDGDGTPESVRDEIDGLVAKLTDEINTRLENLTGVMGTFVTVDEGQIKYDKGGSGTLRAFLGPNDDNPDIGWATAPQGDWLDLYRAAYNLYFVLKDESRGAHNAGYAINVLQSSIKKANLGALIGTPFAP